MYYNSEADLIYCHCYIIGQNSFYNGYPYSKIEAKAKHEIIDTNLNCSLDK